MKYIGIDLGGTNIKVALVNEENQVVAEGDRPTNLPRTPEAVCDDIVGTIQDLLAQTETPQSAIGGVGIGCPGTVDDVSGFVRYSNNLDWREFNLRGYMQEKTGFAAALGNDANVAALGEAVAGSAKGTDSAIIITLGTGVGSGVVMNGEILTGHNGAAAEIGHMVIEKGGHLCTCGRQGCLECYASATALIRMTQQAIEENPASGLAKLAKERDVVDGRTSFDAMHQGDQVAAKVVDTYISYLALGLANIINIFQPEIISLSGGISKEKENLLLPLRAKVYGQVFGGLENADTRIEVCTLGYKAGLIGAAVLARHKAEKIQHPPAK